MARRRRHELVTAASGPAPSAARPSPPLPPRPPARCGRRGAEGAPPEPPAPSRPRTPRAPEGFCQAPKPSARYNLSRTRRSATDVSLRPLGSTVRGSRPDLPPPVLLCLPGFGDSGHQLMMTQFVRLLVISIYETKPTCPKDVSYCHPGDNPVLSSTIARSWPKVRSIMRTSSKADAGSQHP
ncbi:TANK-binding kinase 1-binding protein 1-like [Aythya fuligula]|uniref:TANK-binding kinase 1-binding protein 1-like n=1 Tax=Aythya fuligula TaxID=219594 RepID=A0A6J3CZY1_AYTFU|nr:TANK-binding kinase 1-binding protein 1-like [Aythya fuligula]